MKLKYIILLSGLGIAFAAVSLWVMLSGGKSANAVRAKFRIGGLMLTLTGMLTAASCNGPGPGIMCYDPVMPVHTSFSYSYQNEFKVGDVVAFTLDEVSFKSYIFIIKSIDGAEIQRGAVEIEGNAGRFTIGETDFRGDFFIEVYGDLEDGHEGHSYIGGSDIFTLK